MPLETHTRSSLASPLPLIKHAADRRPVHRTYRTLLSSSCICTPPLMHEVVATPPPVDTGCHRRASAANTASLSVDDLIFTGSNPSMFGEFKEAMTKEFEMTDIGLMAYYLGIEVNQREDGSFISQADYAREILKKFRMDNSKPINASVECGVKLSKHDKEEKVDPTFFKSLVGSLRYLTCTRPDILYVVGLVSRYMEDPTTTHLKIAKRILRYIKAKKGALGFFEQLCQVFGWDLLLPLETHAQSSLASPLPPVKHAVTRRPVHRAYHTLLSSSRVCTPPLMHGVVAAPPLADAASPLCVPTTHTLPPSISEFASTQTVALQRLPPATLDPF
ncbi:hypothetical protein ZIOFF_041952 [Zingiber officinale]|uniref:Reverse transcriptase Ty1/copia-type domain-containing protein n=1 Tax=Zingiber officinale TaxID=94328 RepID=A0A8J5G7E2_ZINOF|nr:hypothetical protein ZIOFF_041952 [Zingiber officinale]